MEVIVLEKTKYNLHYNCSFYDYTRIPYEERAHPFWGAFLLIGYVFFMCLYVPCLWAMCVSSFRHGSSYKLMIQLGFTQMIGIHFAGPYTAFQAIFGSVFCSAPNFKYVADGLVSIHWVVSSTTCDVLGFNRLCALYSPELARRMFDGKRLYFWMAFPLVYGAVMYWNMKPLIFNSPMMAYFMNAHYGYFGDPNGYYRNPLFTFHNTTICCTEIVIYIMMPILYFRAARVAPAEFRQKMRHEKKIFIQVILIGLINFFASLVYILIQAFPVTLATSLIGTIGWFMTQGITSVVYLTANKSIRYTILKKLGLCSGRVSYVSTHNRNKSHFSSAQSNSNHDQQEMEIHI